MSVSPVTVPVIARMWNDVQKLYSADALSVLAPNSPVPRVTLGTTASDQEPLHVMLMPTASDFGITGALTGGVYMMTFHMELFIVATASDMLEAARIAGDYQAVAMQITLCDVTLGSTVREVGVPAIKDSDSWCDSDGRCHAGYLLDYECAQYVYTSKEAKQILEKE